jgi:hypothetical protein
MYDDQDRPPWLRNLRPARPEPAPGAQAADSTVAQAVAEPGTVEAQAEAEAELHSAITRQQTLLLAILLWGNVTILGCLCLLATGTVVP